jgi:protein SCO1/2
MSWLALLALTTATLAPAAPASRLGIIEPAPDFALTTETGATLRMSDLKGKVCVVSFIFTTCSGSCPATTHRMGQLQTLLNQGGLGRDNAVRLLSISLDPARDTPEVLRRYMELYDADPATWTFLTGNRERVSKVIAAWGMWVKPAANGQLDHPSRVFLVDRKGRIREIYDLSFFRPGWVVEDIRLLLKE